jgi:hypothetical protein
LPAPLPVEDLQHCIESIHLAFARIETKMVDLQKYKAPALSANAVLLYTWPCRKIAD